MKHAPSLSKSPACTADLANKVAVLVPLYKEHLDPLESFSLDHSLSALRNRDVYFMGPDKLRRDYYEQRHGSIPWQTFDRQYFASIAGYNRLLLSRDFYTLFLRYEFMLILQTDAIVLQDHLDYWCGQPFDYVGAPWPDGVELFVNAGPFEGDLGKRVKVHVGNGGLSLRRVRKCLSLLDEYNGIIEIFTRTGSSEDLFFSFMGSLSVDFVLPNEITASRFALELKPSYYFAVNGNRCPMGGHAWWKYEPEFWRAQIPDLPAFAGVNG